MSLLSRLLCQKLLQNQEYALHGAKCLPFLFIIFFVCMWHIKAISLKAHTVLTLHLDDQVIDLIFNCRFKKKKKKKLRHQLPKCPLVALAFPLSVALYGESRRGREQYFASPWAKPSCSFHREVMNYYTSYLFSIHACLPNVIQRRLKSQTQLFMALFSYHSPVHRVNHAAPHTSKLL